MDIYEVSNLEFLLMEMLKPNLEQFLYLKYKCISKRERCCRQNVWTECQQKNVLLGKQTKDKNIQVRKWKYNLRKNIMETLCREIIDNK